MCGFGNESVSDACFRDKSRYFDLELLRKVDWLCFRIFQKGVTPDPFSN